MTTENSRPHENGTPAYPIDQILKIRVLNFFNRVIQPIQIVNRIYDDPNFGTPSKQARGITLATSANIIQHRGKIKNKKFTSLDQIRESNGVGIDTLHDILFSFLSGKRNKSQFNSTLNNTIVQFINDTTDPKILVARIKDDPIFEKKQGRGLTLTTANNILDFRNALPKKKLINITQLTAISGLGEDTLHDILYSFWVAEKSSDDIDLTLEADQKWESKLFDLQEQVSNPEFNINLLSNRSTVFSDFELPENEIINSVLPPKLTTEKSETLLTLTSDKNKVQIEKISDKAIKALENRDNTRIKKVVERLKKEGLKNTNGTFTTAAKESISSIIQKPQDFLDDLGVTLTNTEKKSLWTGFTPAEAEAMTQWKSDTESNDAPVKEQSFQDNIKKIKKLVADDPALKLQWLTKPKETFLNFFPDYDPWKLKNLPEPLSPEVAEQLVYSTKLDPPPDISKNKHNSSDLKFGFSIKIVHDIFKYLIKFPLKEQYPDNTQTPFALLEITEFPYPEIINPDLNLLRSSAKANFTSYILGTQYDATLEINLAYSIFAVKDRLFFSYDPDNTTIIVTQGNNQALGNKPKEALDGIFRIMGNSFEYRLNLPSMSLPLSDQVEVLFDSIQVHDDKDTFGSGELYFELALNDDKHLFGQYDANSGDTIALNKRFLFDKNKLDNLNINVRGKDRDFLASTSDAMGSNFKLHQKDINLYGAYSLTAYTHEIQYEMVQIVVETLFRIFCWFVDVIVKILNSCAKLVGIRVEKRRTCRQTSDTVFGWIRKATTVNVKNYTLQYRINELPAPDITKPTDLFEFDKIEMTNDAIFICLNLKEFAGLTNNASRTAFQGSLQDEMTLIISENLLSKAMQAINIYGPVSRYFSSSFDDISSYYSVQTQNNIQVTLNNGFLYSRFPIAGSAGLNVIGLNPSLNTPNAIMIKTSIFTEGFNPFNNLEKNDIALSVDSVWLEGGNFVTALSNLLLAVSQIFFLWPRMTGATQLKLISLSKKTPTLNDYYQLQFSDQQTQTTNDEVIFKSKVGVQLIDGVSPPAEKLYNQQLVIVSPETVFGTNGSVADNLIAATSMALDNNSNIYVNDVAVGKIVKYDPSGTELTTWGSWGIGDGEFAFPFQMAFDVVKNRILITDTINRRVQIFDTDGNYLSQWGGWNDQNYNFNVPQLITVNPVNGDILVVDAAKNYRVQHFDSDLNFIREWGGNGNLDAMFVGITSIAVNSIGEVFISDFSLKKIKKYTSDGTYVNDWNIKDESDTQFLITLTHLSIGTDDQLSAYAPGLLPQIKTYSKTGQFLFNVEPNKPPSIGSNWNTLRAFSIDNTTNTVYVLQDKVFKYNSYQASLS